MPNISIEPVDLCNLIQRVAVRCEEAIIAGDNWQYHANLLVQYAGELEKTTNGIFGTAMKAVD